MERKHKKHCTRAVFLEYYPLLSIRRSLFRHGFNNGDKEATVDDAVNFQTGVIH